MKYNIGSIFLRKLTTTFVTTTFLSMLFAFDYLSDGFGTVYNQGNHFIGWFVVYAMYIGLIILIYGNVVSIAVEILQKKWFHQHDSLYVFLLGIFGLANGILFQNALAAFYGMVAAMIYGILDKWLLKRSLIEKSMKPFIMIPIASLLLCWSFLQLTSPPMPPFTKEDAVAHATSGVGSVTDEFPNQIGKWKGTIGEYEVIRETSVEEIGNENYIVTFTENWKNGHESGTWTLAYQVKRQSMTLHSHEGDIPLYNKMD